MTSQYSNNRAGDRPQGSFIRWSAPSRHSSSRDLSDPGFVVDRKRLYKYLNSLEGLSGE
ncbi:hypothetical protein [Nodosilinea nodulosa]|uniref:hypothetical protein n=1 Tax=Nodosilinea nodulosa TaxID=416001 RepID=UPI00031EEC8E|nr:hypothetical protein [Nodosilinea nodulosa]